VKGLGRIPSPQDDRDYQLATLMAALPAPAPPRKTWHSDRVLDQQETSHCVGFAYAAWGIAQPVESPFTDRDAHAVYRRAKIIGGDPGGEYGSNLRDGAKAMVYRKCVQSYWFSKSVDEAAEFVANHGTVVLGIDWHAGMMKPNAAGLIVPTGEVVGGHAILWRGVAGRFALLRNSWGTDWGVGGDCKILLRDLETIFAHFGEACAMVQKPLPVSTSFFHDLFDWVKPRLAAA